MWVSDGTAVTHMLEIDGEGSDAIGPELGPQISGDVPAASQSPGLLLWRVTNHWQAAMRAALAPHDLTHVQYVLLASLTWLGEREPGRLVTQVDLAAFAATDPMMTSQVVRTLERAGLVERLPHPTDGRARVLRATPEGGAAARRATADVEAADAAFFARVDAPAFAAQLAMLAAARDAG